MNRRLRVVASPDAAPVDDRRKFTLRLPDELGEKLEACANESGRSLNAEIVWRLRRSVDGWKLDGLRS